MGDSLTSPVDTIKGEVRFAWLGCRGDSTSHPLPFLEQSLADPRAAVEREALPQRTRLLPAGPQDGSTRRHLLDAWLD